MQYEKKYAILKLFFEKDECKKSFQIAEICKQIDISKIEAGDYLKKLEEEGFIVRLKHRVYNYRVYFAKNEKKPEAEQIFNGLEQKLKKIAQERII